MSFPYEFSKKSGDYDIFSPIINFTGNAGIVAVGGIALGVIAKSAFKALGMSQTAQSIATAIPVSIGAVGAAGALAGGGCLIYFIIQIQRLGGIYRP